MFSKEEAAQLRKEFWTSFGKSFPRKWLLYNTKIKGFALKFQADRKNASVCLDIEHGDEIANELLYDQMLSLRSILETEIPEIIFDAEYELESGKIIKRIYIPFDKKFSIHKRAHIFPESATPHIIQKPCSVILKITGLWLLQE